MKKALVSVILPAYNECDNLIRLIPEIVAQFRRSDRWNAEIIVVDDNSPDGTKEVLAEKFKRDIRLIVRKRERGLGTAIAEGVRVSRGSVILGMDADGNHDPRYIPALLSGLTHADLVIGSRYISGGGMAMGIQYIVSFISNRILRYVLKFPVHDNTSGFYAVRIQALRSLDLDSIYFGYGDYHLRLVWRAVREGMNIVEVPVWYAPRHHGQSKSRLPIMLIMYARTVIRLCTGMS